VKRYPQRQRYTVTVEFETDMSLSQAEIREYVEDALKGDIGRHPPESPLREIDRKTIKATPAVRSHRPRAEIGPRK
jgi:hypothetical protein